MPEPRVDTHHHVLPPDYKAWLVDHGLYRGRDVPWSVPATLAMMDRRGIRAAVVSTAPIGVRPAPADHVHWARAVNEFTAGMVRDRPDRFGFFATLPLPDVDAALAELAVAYDELGADGVLLPANVHGRYLGDPAFEPVFVELDRRGAVVFVHPTGAAVPPADGIPPYVCDFLLDTVRTAADLVRSGRTRRFPAVRIILSHGGGFLPYAAHRMATAPGVWGGLTPAEVIGELRGFWFDTALTSSPTSLPALTAFARPDHLLYGSDWPFADEETGYYDAFLEAHPLPGDVRAGIDHANAEALFPRVGARPVEAGTA